MIISRRDGGTRGEEAGARRAGRQAAAGGARALPPAPWHTLL